MLILRPHCMSTCSKFCSNIVLSATGCFVFTRGFHLVAMDGEEPAPGSLPTSVEGIPKRWAGMDSAVFLMAFVISEILVSVTVFCG